ncbi:CRISPR-associated exonuclease Cas4 [Actinoalloteichus hoggarensis]|uniref:PD-(D/E)XK nuclease superfamily protein n=1 Tax=Actinoalloteichus hoggarensis TaxID=1470176 RepID=A0A221W6T6_9PSEU|nr:CRISPR-associated protein Cas4 [Actinoalloteichus hoggarensis]ASO21585.1 PD-(D/E)XK nuclease superfamily protein [Actinoalloteichus hoggarensis]MBB5922177.1 CRISPR-associated exonuclease Cas4 [Actinoalloteichus hoggarensis]
MITADDVGGVHVKYLYHCPRQLWLYARGFRPEHLNDAVQLGTAVHELSYSRFSPVDLGAATLDHLDNQLWVHEIKHSAKRREADHAQARHYCHQLVRIGVDVQGAVLHYRNPRKTERFPYTDDEHQKATEDIDRVLDIVAHAESPPRLGRTSCRGCSYLDYCWSQ